MSARRILCVLLMLPMIGAAWGHDGKPPAYRPPLLITVNDSQVPSLDCTASAVRVGDTAAIPLAMLASACAEWTEQTCELWVPQSGLAAVLSVASSLMSPNAILGHEATHCWLHDFHGALPWF